jgi:ParB/RepB/Spo0J family partition protein
MREEEMIFQTMNNNDIQMIDVGRLMPSPTNPRKHFAPGPLEELAANIARIGVQTPLHVRWIEGINCNGYYEIIAGERRWRAVGRAMEMMPEDAVSLREVPCKVVTWSDEEVVEFQLIENLQREDLSPLEEADGYVALQARGLTVEQIAERIGREVTHVWRALKWSRLPELGRQAFEAGVMSKEVATLVARIPDAMERVRAMLELVFFPDDSFEGVSDFDFEQAVADARAILAEEPETIEPMTVKAARECVASRFMRSLRGVKFDLADADLVPVVGLGTVGGRVHGGACTDCPHRVGANPLFADELAAGVKGLGGRVSGLDPDTCTLPGCLTLKTRAFWQRAAEQAEQQGKRLLPAEEAEGLFDPEGRLRYGAPFVLLDERPGAELVDDEAARKKTWRKLLAKVELPVVVAIDAAGRPREMVQRELAISAVNQKAEVTGKESPFADADRATDRPEPDAAKEAREKKKLEEKIEARAVVIALRKMMMRVACEGLGIDELRGVVDAFLEFECNREQLVLIGQALDQQIEAHEQADELKQMREHLWAVERSRDELLSVVVVAIAARQRWAGLKALPLVKVAGLLGVSLTESRMEARDELKKKTRAKKGVKPEVVTEIVNAEVAVDGILAEGDAQREAMPSRAVVREEMKRAAEKVVAKRLEDAPGDVQGTEVLPVARVIECKDVETWVDALLHAPLPCSAENEHGVLTDAVEIRLPMLNAAGKKLKKGTLAVQMGMAYNGQYAAGWVWDCGVSRSTAPVRCFLEDLPRVAVACEVVQTLRDLARGDALDAMAGVLSTALVLLENELPQDADGGDLVRGEEVVA